METEIFLPTRLFLLAYNPAKQRLTSQIYLGTLLRAAALAELAFAGYLADENGRVVVTKHPGHGASGHGGGVLGDPVLSAVLAEVAAGSRPRKWSHWIGRRGGACLRLVREQLATEQVIRAERQRVLGIFPVWNITLRDPRTRSRLADTARRTLRGGEPVERIDRRDAAVVALAANGELRTVVSRGDRRKFKRRIEALAEQVGPVVKGLRSAVQSQQAAAAS